MIHGVYVNPSIIDEGAPPSKNIKNPRPRLRTVSFHYVTVMLIRCRSATPFGESNLLKIGCSAGYNNNSSLPFFTLANGIGFCRPTPRVPSEPWGHLQNMAYLVLDHGRGNKGSPKPFFKMGPIMPLGSIGGNPLLILVSPLCPLQHGTWHAYGPKRQAYLAN